MKDRRRDNSGLNLHSSHQLRIQAPIIKVAVCAGSAAELAHLDAAIASSTSMSLVSSTLGISALRDDLADSQPDVLLEQVSTDELANLAAADCVSADLPAVLLVGELEYAAARDLLRNRESGVRAVLPAWASNEEIEIAVEAAARGLLLLHPEIGVSDEEAGGSGRSDAGGIEQLLSPRENEILQLLAAGLGNKEIAWRLKISEHTVKFHVTSIFNKLNASSRTEAVAIGMRRGLIAL